ncbi:U6 snRNA-associated Sm-like protein LSm7 [Tremella mesenterica]|uniref:U6 snRNA-associated Sm-like protein LSm7 n=2 Tax=Tremella mesenterica TaxID=5217 RepID=A0A4Q1BGJ8_TREME|nr:U6 snRNA-associated Sm-like protein LSm7 [Tremella mesenterica]
MSKNVPPFTPRGAPQRGRGAAPAGPDRGEKKKRESILNLANYVDKSIRVKFMGAREVTGTLKGFDQLMNLVMDDVVEEFENGMPSRSLGLVVLRGPNITLILPTDGSAGLFLFPAPCIFLSLHIATPSL